MDPSSKTPIKNIHPLFISKKVSNKENIPLSDTLKQKNDPKKSSSAKGKVAEKNKENANKEPHQQSMLYYVKKKGLLDYTTTTSSNTSSSKIPLSDSIEKSSNTLSSSTPKINKSSSSSTKTPKNNNNDNNTSSKKQIDTPIARPMFRRSISAHSILDVIGKNWLQTPRPKRVSTVKHYVCIILSISILEKKSY